MPAFAALICTPPPGKNTFLLLVILMLLLFFQSGLLMGWINRVNFVLEAYSSIEAGGKWKKTIN